VDGVNLTFYPGISGDAVFTSGPLLDLSVTTDSSGNPQRSLYHYGPDELSVTGRSGGLQIGAFVAPILDLTINVFAENNGCPLFEVRCGRASLTALLGPGLFDPAFAQTLGVLGPSINGSLIAGIDRIDGTPSSVIRFGGASSAWGLDVNVPEPPANALLLAAAGAFLIRRRRPASA
jgi:hypothetical protein